ncbi:GNAT family N-acetyltransferase [Salinicoccus kekensis]|uniref:Ribosomal protein S18 acetylase RimI-like enzyme n=1 Tax=Salinicoccus kekensis TaxID=714307 RepID=A0A285UHF6_9STAP|nr:GNAT family N-acetyltransferase [Salinicoccus kekensis]SOC41242.1 ribosomal protein S18 acetylase RimI-like enzyme [Salinicoccus kekensis]
MDLTIRKVTVEDAERVAEICRTGWLDTVEGIFSDTYKRKTVEFWYAPGKVEQDIKKGHYSYVAEAGGEVAGVIGGGMTGSSVNEIFVFYVDGRFRYMGIGKKLLETFTAHFRNKGARQQWASVQEGNTLGLPFYEAQGFRCEGIKETRTGTGEIQRSLRMKREIG